MWPRILLVNTPLLPVFCRQSSLTKAPPYRAKIHFSAFSTVTKQSTFGAAGEALIGSKTVEHSSSIPPPHSKVSNRFVPVPRCSVDGDRSRWATSQNPPPTQQPVAELLRRWNFVEIPSLPPPPPQKNIAWLPAFPKPPRFYYFTSPITVSGVLCTRLAYFV